MGGMDKLHAKGELLMPHPTSEKPIPHLTNPISHIWLAQQISKGRTSVKRTASTDFLKWYGS
jgi:hypothetical protein